MARFGVFNRNDNSLQPINRSLQEFDHSMSTTLPYGQITPIFYEEMLPNERLSVNVTNLVRSIPMVSPMLSRVKIITRFYAVPKRILWLGFEEYIDGVKDSQFALTEPFIVNFNRIAEYKYKSYLGGTTPEIENAFESKSALKSWVDNNFSNLTDLGTVGIGLDCINTDLPNVGDVANTRALARQVIINDNKFKRTDLMGYQFFPHELGDYFNAPLYIASLASDKSGRFSAYPFAAYQLCYSYGYRKPNVQDRVDDFYQMSPAGDSLNFDPSFPLLYVPKHIYNEFPSFYTFFYQDKTNPILFHNTPLASYALATIGSDKASRWSVMGHSIVDDIGSWYYSQNRALSTDSDDILRTSWSNVEHFPLRGGANAVMQALNWADSGTPDLTDSLISLTRLRYANWQSDRFNEANPWQQRGTEAQIPVVGSVSFDQVSLYFTGNPASLSFTPSGTVESSFFGGTQDINLPVSVDTAANETLFMKVRNDAPITPGFPFQVNSFDLDNAIQTESEILSGTEFKVKGQIPVTGAVTSTFTGSQGTISYTPSGSVSGNVGGSVSGLYVSPSSFRFAMQLQKIKEMSARTDGRFKSFLSMFYGARSKDARLDRPEFIGGSVQVLNINEVEQTSETDNTPLGTLGGRGFSAKRSNTFDYRASEHTCILGLVHIVPDSEYIGGLERTRHLTSPFDTPMPQFAGLSEQPIRMAELAFRPSSLSSLNQDLNDVTFGFEPRFNELRVKHSYATGAFRDYWNSTGSYQYYKPWLITRQFGFKPSVLWNQSAGGMYYPTVDYQVPTLSDEFLSMRDTVDYSNFEVTDPKLLMPFMLDSFFNVRWVRVIPSRGIPRI